MKYRINRGFLVTRRQQHAHRRRPHSSDQGPSNVNVDAPRYHGWKVKRRLQLVIPPPHYVLSEARGQNTTSTSAPPPLYQVMKYEVPVVLVLLTLKYQGKTESIFRENPMALWCFFAATFAYWLLVGTMKEMADTLSSEWIQTLRCSALASALLSAISLICSFLPYPLSLMPLAIVITSPISLAVLYAFSLFIGVVEWAVNKMHGVVVRHRGGCVSVDKTSEV